MSYLNTYKPPIIHSADYVSGGDEPYDLNFCLPVPEELSSERVKLVPFVPSIHSTQLLAAVTDHPEVYRWLPYGPFHPSEPSGYNTWFAERIALDPATLLFAIIDKTSPSPSSHPDQGGALAGVAGFHRTDAKQLRAELGHVIVFPPWQRTFVATNAACLLLVHALETPNPKHELDSEGYSNGISNVKGGDGWGLRRVWWIADERNARSMATALRMGMRLEGVTRWDQTLRPPKEGLPVTRPGDPKADWVGRHSATFALCWDEYDREKLDKMISRK